LFAAALLPVGGAAQAAGYLDGAMKSPASFDEALGLDNIQQVSMLEPDLAEGASAPAAAPQSMAAGSSSSCGCGSMGDCCGDNCCGDSCCDLASCCGPTWTARMGVVVLERDRPDSVTLLRNTGNGVRVFDGDWFDFDYEVGPDVSLFRHTSAGNALEVRYFGVYDWEARAGANLGGSITIPTIPVTIMAPMVNVNALYESSLHSTEVNWRINQNGPVTWLTGFRWIELNDTLDVSATVGGLATQFGWDTNNHLYGSQIGADVDLWDRGGPLVLEGLIKAGVYGNDADNSFFADANFNPGPALASRGENNDVAFVGEVSFTTVYQLRNNWALRSGYQMLWVEGVALASDQIAVTSPLSPNSGIDDDSGVFYHGALIGIERSW
jgi:hypothetical protein